MQGLHKQWQLGTIYMISSKVWTRYEAAELIGDSLPIILNVCRRTYFRYSLVKYTTSIGHFLNGPVYFFVVQLNDYLMMVISIMLAEMSTP